jgi:hypothetical protein
MMNDMQRMNGGFQGTPVPGKREVPVTIAFGESEAAIPCVNCSKMSQSGFFVQFSGTAMLCCVRCVVLGVDKYQKLHPEEKLLDMDVEVHEKELNEAADAVRDRVPELSESKALEAAKAAIESL